VQRFRNHGVLVIGGSRNARVEGLTASTNCTAGIRVMATAFDTLVEGNTVVRNGATSSARRVVCLHALGKKCTTGPRDGVGDFARRCDEGIHVSSGYGDVHGGASPKSLVLQCT